MKRTLLPEGLKGGEMDSFAGSESRDFIPFYLGNELNGQPKQTQLEDQSAGGNSNSATANDASETASPIPPDLGTTPAIHSPRIMASGIEILEYQSSRSSVTAPDLSAKQDENEHTTVDAITQVLQSPDYSPPFINLLASENDSSDESLQAYVARKVESMRMGLSDQFRRREQLPTLKESETELITIARTSSRL